MADVDGLTEALQEEHDRLIKIRLRTASATERTIAERVVHPRHLHGALRNTVSTTQYLSRLDLGSFSSLRID